MSDLDIQQIKDQYPDWKVNALGKKDMDNIRSMLAQIERLTAENTNLWDALNLEKRLKNRFIAALEAAGIDPDEIGDTVSTRPCPDIGKDAHNHPANPCPECSGTGKVHD